MHITTFDYYMAVASFDFKVQFIYSDNQCNINMDKITCSSK